MDQPENQAERAGQERAPTQPEEATSAVRSGAALVVPDGALANGALSGDAMAGDVAPVASGPEGLRLPWLVIGVAAVLAVSTALLGGLYLDAKGDRDDHRRRVAELSVREAELARQATQLTVRVTELERQLSTERARFTAVEPCLRQVTTPSPVEVIPQAELDRLLAEAKRNPPTRPGSTVRLGEITASGAMLPACKDVKRHLR